MVAVKSFSLRRERNIVRLELMCASSKFREKMIHVDIPVPQARSLVRELGKAVESGTSEEYLGKGNPSYIG